MKPLTLLIPLLLIACSESVDNYVCDESTKADRIAYMMSCHDDGYFVVACEKSSIRIYCNRINNIPPSDDVARDWGEE